MSASREIYGSALEEKGNAATPERGGAFGDSARGLSSTAVQVNRRSVAAAELATREPSRGVPAAAAGSASDSAARSVRGDVDSDVARPVSLAAESFHDLSLAYDEPRHDVHGGGFDLDPNWIHCRRGQ